MIAKLRGIIDTIGDDYCIVDVNGVGYLVFASAKTLGKLTRGKQYCLLTETVVREDSISLFGFYDAWEKEWFLTLTKVQGVGAKVCLSILSVLSPSQLARLVTELKDKIVTVPWEATSNGDLSQEGKMDEQKAAEITENYEDNLVAMTDDPSKMEDAI